MNAMIKLKYLLPRLSGAFLLLLFFSGSIIAQQNNYIKGKVINGETDSVIANASVFITNTSKGTTTNSIGQFEIINAPVGTYDLVVSCIGFETQVYTYKASQLPLQIRVEMKPKAQELETVVVEPYEKDGWETWGKFFIENFIGTTKNAKSCTIKNYKTLRFRNSKKRNQLTVTADDPLIIENKALGYNIQYQLEGFKFDFKEGSLLYYGYTLFKELNKKGPKGWQLKNREKAYSGSIQHFMSSLYNNRLAQEGFEVKRLFKAPNLEKERIRKLYRENLKNTSHSKDSSAYYERIFRQPDILETYGKDFLTPDSLVTANDSLTKKLFFPDYLYVVYKNEKEDPEYLDYTHEKRPVFYQRSVVFELNGKAVFMDARGNYFMPTDFMSYGYWGWNEKISNILPLDYK